jgi:leucyl aminopeptidase
MFPSAVAFVRRAAGTPGTRAAIAAAVALFLLAAPAPAAAVEDDVWITIGADAFAVATDVFRSPGLAALPRLAEAEGVVLTRIPADGIEALSVRIHEELHRCAGFVRHESLADAMRTIERLRSPQPTLGALPFAIDTPHLVTPLLAQVSEAEILATITALSTQFPNRYHLHANTHQSHLWIRDAWDALAEDRPDVTVELYSHGGLTPQPSVILTIPGTTLADQVVVIGGHQDSIRSGCSISTNSACVAPGADDDASGIATLTEVIRVALANGFAPQRTVKFMAYAAEEVGLVGSRNIAQAFNASDVEVVAALQQDMTGYSDSATFDLALITDSSFTDSALNAFLGDLLDTYLPELNWTTTTCGYACSDHAAWAENGYPAAFSFEAPFGDHSPVIHSLNDNLASLGNSAAHAAKLTRLAAAFLVETSIDFDADVFADDFESGDTSAWSSVGSGD